MGKVYFGFLANMNNNKLLRYSPYSSQSMDPFLRAPGSFG